jgi:hypothetical protein
LGQKLTNNRLRVFENRVLRRIFGLRVFENRAVRKIFGPKGMN